MSDKKDWLKNAVDPSKAGMFADTSTDEIKEQLKHLKKMGPHKSGSPSDTKMKELLFALKARSSHGFRKAK